MFTWSHLTSFVTTQLLSLKFLICLMNNRERVEIQAYVSTGPDITEAFDHWPLLLLLF